MKKPSLFLFIMRLAFYLTVASLLLIHPGISISYDRVGFIQWFLIIPIGALLAFLPPPKARLRNKFIITLIPIGILSVMAGGFSYLALAPFSAGAISFMLTLLLFHYPRWGKISVLEPFFLAWVCLRLLAFSRSGEDAAQESLSLTQFTLVWTAAVFFLHSAVVYFCLYPGSRGAKAEGLVFGISAAAALALVLFVLPADFIRNTIIDNLLPDRRDRMLKPSDSEGIPDSGGGRRRDGRRSSDRGSERRPSLHGLSEHDWPGGGSQRSRGQGGGEQDRQYTVMVVASKHEPLYMGNSIRGSFDPAAGFLSSPDEVLNSLPSRRLFVTWFDNEPVFDLGRERRNVFSLSTLSQKFLPYRPFAIEPTILSENSGPLRYIHNLVSYIHIDDPIGLLFAPVRNLNSLEKIDLAPYLELPLKESDRELFLSHLDKVLESWQKQREGIMGDAHNEYMEKVLAILHGFSDYQYTANFDENSSIPALIDFLFNTMEGDCVEFSNSAALLGRLAGIPSRVVTGYLAAEDLQSDAHLRGLSALRNRIPALQRFPFEDLYLVTNAHGHSWPQFYIPDYGWLDFEATLFAIPPVGFGDANLRDVVIPLLDENQVFSPIRSFPWKAVFRVLAFLAVLAVIGAYSLRYGRELMLRFGVQRGGTEGARSLYLLLLARLAADGKPIKPVSKTAPEYAQLFSGAGDGASFAAFAAIYSELRWRTFTDKALLDERFGGLKNEYNRILAENRRKGLRAFFVRIFSLRGLLYL